MIRVAHVITELSVGGAESMLSRLVQRIDASKFSQVVISLSDLGPIGQEILKSGVRVEAVGMRPGRSDPVAFWKLARLLRSFQPDVLQTWLYHADFAGLMVHRLPPGPRLIWNLRCSDMDFSQYSKITAMVVNACARFSQVPDAVVVNSEAGQRYHASIGYRPRRWEIIPNGFDLDHFRGNQVSRERLRVELRIPADTLLVGLVARFDPMKDHETFLKAAAELHMQHDDVHFVLCGTGVDNDNGLLSGQIGHLGLKSVIHLLGERRDVHEITAALDIAASSSRWGEGFPNVIGEAMACSIPVVATDVGDAATLLGEAGIVVPAGRPRCFASALRDLVEAGPTRRHEMGAVGRRRVEESYSLPNVVRRYELLYEGLASSVRHSWLH